MTAGRWGDQRQEAREFDFLTFQGVFLEAFQGLPVWNLTPRVSSGG